MEIWGFEPQTYGLQSHRSSQLSYTPGYINKRERKKRERTKTVCRTTDTKYTFLYRKEVIQPHLPVRLPCYDFTLLTKHTFDSVLLKG